mmetsp:Transcript_59917/g.104816  ORF Transcript_59917/g.104816 Transcript_59917/m.104816 type:complete len:488 (+) Transcript_59917:41-1504(+)
MHAIVRMTLTSLALTAYLCTASAALAATPRHEFADWSQGEMSWKQASLPDDEKDLWSKLNACDTRVLHGSAPLTLLFGVSKFWSHLSKRRAVTQRTEQPFEVHVVGAAYPFEGRSDWSLLASRRPKDVAKVRIVLILGTPWHTDNVPLMNTNDYNESMSLLEISLTGRNVRRSAGVRDPEAGKWHDDFLECSKKSMQAKEDKGWRKADVCRDHGNGLEVVCVEKYYQDVADELPSPDVVAMFSPGFPQLARRSWDEVLRKLLLAEVPIMVSDLVSSYRMDDVFKNGKKTVVAAGKRWKVRKQSMEDGMTLMAMQAYGARRLGSFRNPFPIFNFRRGDDAIAKNGVLQVFHGRQDNAKPFKMPRDDEVLRRKDLLERLNLAKYFEDKDNAKEVKESLLIPTSTAYERAMSQLYLPTMRDLIKDHHKHGDKGLSGRPLAKLQELGLAPDGKKAKSSGKCKKGTCHLKPWGVEDWIYIIQHLNGATDEVF